MMMLVMTRPQDEATPTACLPLLIHHRILQEYVLLRVPLRRLVAQLQRVMTLLTNIKILLQSFLKSLILQAAHHDTGRILILHIQPLLSHFGYSGGQDSRGRGLISFKNDPRGELVQEGVYSRGLESLGLLRISRLQGCEWLPERGSVLLSSLLKGSLEDGPSGLLDCVAFGRGFQEHRGIEGVLMILHNLLLFEEEKERVVIA